MRQLPNGTVTFLFSDIEGSTKLLDELGADAYADALAEHRRVMRQAFAANDGVEVDTQGDAFFVAFPTARGALSAAARAQSALTAGSIRVRMGIHSGEPLLTDEGYVGIDVHRGARVMSAGHGGQVLVSHATYALLDDDSGLIDLGRHRLKDLTEPQPLYQLGEGEFPSLKTLNQTNLPVQPTPLVGREAELGEVLGLLGESRLVTLTGAGGSGKTRLALQAAAELVDEYEDGVWWVSLAALRDAELVEPTIAQVVGAKNDLAEHLRAKKTLLLLDNLEQLLEAAPRIAELLADAPELHVLATSRERLTLSAEQEYPVPTLVLAEAVALFTARARRLKPRFDPDEDVEEICRRLDGLPLALELAAARIKVLTAAQILERLGHSLDLLTTGARDVPERQRTLRATIAWSYDLLGPDERELFARLSVFAGSFDFDAAEAVCDAGLDALAALVDKSLIRQTDEGRFFMLETIRDFAAERLNESGEASKIEQLHGRHYVQLTVSAAHQDGGYVMSFENMERLRAEGENLRRALETAGEQADASSLADAVSSGWAFWISTGAVHEGIRWTRLALDHREHLSEEELVGVLIGGSELMRLSGDLESAERLKLEALDLGHREDDESRAHWVTGTLADLAELALERGEVERARALAEESLAKGGGARARSSLAEVMLRDGELEGAAQLFEEAAEGYSEDLHAFNYAYTFEARGEVARRLGDSERASELFAEAARRFERLGDQWQLAECLDGMAAVAMGGGDEQRAGVIAGAAGRLRAESGLPVCRPDRGLDNLPEDALARGRAMSMSEAVAYAFESLD